jgi:cytochrome c oxidase cbb3-type subunit 3
VTPPTVASVATAEVAVADEEPGEARLMTHSYDGIREFDNPLPGWWTSIFIGSIVFAGFYALYFHVVDWGRTDAESYQASLTDYESKRDLRAAAEANNVSEPSLAQAAQDPKVVEHGAAVFKSRCVTCHADDGRGLIGPNLTDLSQKHGSTRMDLYGTISKGVPGTAMLAWGEQMAQTDVLSAAAFVITLRGTNVANGKAPEGARVEKFTAQ